MAEEESTVAMDTPAVEQEVDKSEWGEDISPDKDGKLFKKILSEGSGEGRPNSGNKVFVHYTGRLLDGTVFDSSVERNELFTFELGQGKVIKGWDVGVATMRKGEKCLLTCTPEYAYGDQGAGENIPPNSTLQFEVELFRWQGDDVTGDGGVVKNILKKGDGFASPSEGSSVTVTLRGMIGETVFEERKDFEFCLGEGVDVGVVEGVEKVLEKMNKGEESEVAIQPGYAYGSKGDSSKGVPPNAEVTYIVTLTDFVKVKSSFEYDSVEERISDATATKDKGSQYFKAGKYPLALKVYRRALKLVDKETLYKDEEKESCRPVRVLLRLNVAACLLKMNEGTEALQECEAVLEEDATNIKGIFRKGQALQTTRDYDLAMKCFQEVVKLDPSNRSSRQQILVCKNKMKEQRDKDKKMYTNIFQKLSKLSEREQTKTEMASSDQEGGVAEGVAGDIEKDAITEAMEEEEKQDGRQEEPVNA